MWNDCHVVEPSVSGYYDITPSSNGGYYLIDDNSILTWVNAQGQMIFSQDITVNYISVHKSYLDFQKKKNQFIGTGIGGNMNKLFHFS